MNIDEKYINILKTFSFLDNQEDVVKNILNLYKSSRYKIKKTNINNNKIINHIITGGYGSIFSYEDYIIRITFNEKNKISTEWEIPKNIEKILITNNKEFALIFLNIPITFFENKFLLGLIQYYHCICLIFIYLSDKKKRDITFDYIYDLTKKINCTYMTNIYNILLKKYNNADKIILLFNDIFKKEDSIYIIVHFLRFVNLLAKKTNGFDSMINFNISSKDNLNRITKEDVLNYNLDNKGFRSLKQKILNINPMLLNLFGNIIIQNKAISDFSNLKFEIDNKEIFAYENPYFIKLLITQTLLALYIFNREAGFIHHDFKPDNILTFKCNKKFNIKYNTLNFQFNEKVIFKINDFDHSITDEINNTILHNTQLKPINNIYNDIHFFYTTLFVKKSDNEEINLISKEYYEYFIKQKCKNCKIAYEKNINNEQHLIYVDEYIEDIILKFFTKSKICSHWRI